MARLVVVAPWARASYSHSCFPQVHHTVVLNQENMSTFALLSVDSVEGSLAIVYREVNPTTRQQEEMAPSVRSLVEGFVESCAFHAWSVLL